MENYKGDVDIYQLKSQISGAYDNLLRIREEFVDDPELLSIYEPSALYLVNELESELTDIVSLEYGLKLQVAEPSQSKIDFWISLDGAEFKEGQGPIGQVGAFLTKLNNANKQAMYLISEKLGRIIKSSEIPSLRLVNTAAGSLKLGFNKPTIEKLKSDEQLEFFEDNWEHFKSAIELSELPVKGMQLLISAIVSVNDEKILNELKLKYGEKEVIKIIHYAKELAPSQRSPIDQVKYEGDAIGIPNRVLKTDKETRKKLSEHAKKLLPTTEYIEGTAFVGQADVNNNFFMARPLKYSGNVHAEIRCVFLNYIDPEEISRFLGKKVEIKGYLVSDSNKRLLRLEIDSANLLEQESEE